MSEDKMEFLPKNPDYDIGENEIRADKMPKKNCKKCRGRGYTGLVGDKRKYNYGQKIPCRCVRIRK